MNRRRRVELTIQRQRTDRFPKGELCIDDGVIRAFLGVRDVVFRDRVEFVSRLGLDLICLPTDYGSGDSACRRSGGLPRADTVCWKDLKRWCTETDLFVFVLLDGCYSWCMKLLGFKDFMTTIARHSSKIHSLVQDVNALNAALIRRAASQGAHGIVIADDIAHGTGLMIAPEELRRTFFPSLTRQVELARRAGLSVLFHSDGNLDPVMEDLAGSGVDGLQCLEKAAGMDLESVRKKYGDRLCLWGNLDPAILTVPLNTESLEKQTNAVASVADEGGVIFGTSSGLFQGMHPENIRYLYQLLSRERT